MQLVELRPDRLLLEPNFDGYKLSLEPVPTIRKCLADTRKPARYFPSSDQYSFLHQEFFGHQNLLFSDPWNWNSVYYVNEQNGVESVRQSDGQLVQHAKCLLQIPLHRNRKQGDYNNSIEFVDDGLVLISNGIGGIFLADTGDRSAFAQWKVVFDDVLCEEGEGFIIKHARIDTIGDRRTINILLLQIVGEEAKFLSKLTWIRLAENGDANWERSATKELTSKSTVPFCMLTKGARGVIISCQKSFQFISDSESELKSEAASVQSAQVTPFSWSQSDDDVTVTFKRIESSQKSDYFVKCSRDSILVRYKDETLIAGDLSHKIDPDLTTWNLINDFLQLTLAKLTDGECWSKLTEAGPTESHETNPIRVVNETYTSVPDITSNIEDCDRDENEFFLEEIQAESHSITHRIFLGSNAPLFHKVLTAGQGPAIVLRHDVDACLWQAQGNSDSFKHMGTLNAIAYVTASKQQRKFVDCDPGMSYSVICEPERHVFIYKSEYSTASGLRNRNGTKMKFGQQKLVTLDDTGEVIGMSVQTEGTFLLTQKCVLLLKVSE